MNVRSLFINITNDGFQAVKISLKCRLSFISTSAILIFLNLIITLNRFLLNNITFRQIKRDNMGTLYAPTDATIFMGIFEEKHISKNQEN